MPSAAAPCSFILISIHALREEGDFFPPTGLLSSFQFLSTPSARRATFQLPAFASNILISIHALREEGDKELYLTGTSTDISIHALREEGDYPSRRTTAACSHFYPRPPRGGRLVEVLVAAGHRSISIHALREEGDPGVFRGPLWGAISIHALREEGDRWRRDRWCRRTYFYPRPPRGGRRPAPDFRRMTVEISIHALREEGDYIPERLHRPLLDFYPRPPRGGRRLKVTPK